MPIEIEAFGKKTLSFKENGHECFIFYAIESDDSLQFSQFIYVANKIEIKVNYEKMDGYNDYYLKMGVLKYNELSCSLVSSDISLALLNPEKFYKIDFNERFNLIYCDELWNNRNQDLSKNEFLRKIGDKEKFEITIKLLFENITKFIPELISC
jgi:hypothetical protein